MFRFILYLISCLAVASVPFLTVSGSKATLDSFPGWPAQFEGKVLRELPLSPREQEFTKDFPGRIGRFTDGTREIIIRWVTQETRMLHPSSDCFKGLGFTIKALPVNQDSRNNFWGCFKVKRGKQEYLVKERIFDREGNSWADVSSWYWSALWGKTAGPWWSVVVTESETAE